MLLFVAETGSVSKAAEKASLTVSAVSKRLLELEAQLGVVLFEIARRTTSRAHSDEVLGSEESEPTAKHRLIGTTNRRHCATLDEKLYKV